MLARSGEVERTKVGYTLPTPALAQEHDLHCENLVVVARVNIAQVWPTQNDTPLVRRDKAFGGAIRKDLWFEKWAVHVQEFPNGTVHIQLGAKGEAGLSYLDFNRWCGWVTGKYPRIPMGAWHVKNWEWNVDFYHLRLEGAQAITLQAFNNVWLKLYQKGRRLRLEERQRTDLPLTEALDLLAKVAEDFYARGLVRVETVQDRPGRPPPDPRHEA